VKFPGWSHQSQYPSTSGLGSGNISYHDIIYIVLGRQGINFKSGRRGETGSTDTEGTCV